MNNSVVSLTEYRVNKVRSKALRHYRGLRVEAERLEAMKLLRRVLEVCEAGDKGPLKSDIREFLERSGK